MNWRKVCEIVSAVSVLGYMWLIFHLSSIPGTNITLPAPDYIMHGIAFGGLSFLFTLFFRNYLNLYLSIGCSLIMTFLFGLSDEAHQSFVPFRSPDWRDIAADVIGALVVQLVLVLIIRFSSSRRSEAR